MAANTPIAVNRTSHTTTVSGSSRIPDMTFFASPFEQQAIWDDAELSLLEATVYLDLLMTNPDDEVRANMLPRYLQWFDPSRRLYDLQHMGQAQVGYVVGVLMTLGRRIKHGLESESLTGYVADVMVGVQAVRWGERIPGCLVLGVPVDQTFVAKLDNEFLLWVSFRDLVARCTSHDPQLRQTVDAQVDDFAAELQALLHSAGITAWLAVLMCRCVVALVFHVPVLANIVLLLPGAQLICTQREGLKTKDLINSVIAHCKNYPLHQPLHQMHDELAHDLAQDQDHEVDNVVCATRIPCRLLSDESEVGARKRASGAQRRKARRAKMHTRR